MLMLKLIESKTVYVVMSLILLGINAAAQHGQAADPPGGKSPSNAQKRAVWTLIQLLEASQESQDQVFRIEAEADIADALWGHDRKRAHDYFVDAFSAIDSIKGDQQGPDGTGTTQPAADAMKAELRTRIAALIASHDPALAESLVRELLKLTDHAATD